MSGRVYCPECGTSYANPYEVLDDAQCGVRLTGDTWCNGRLTSAEEAIRSLARARATAHAAGYGEGVATIVVDLRRQAEGLDLTGEKKLARYVGGLARRYADGAHVGAAKKGGG